jgi:hypothetical protein
VLAEDLLEVAHAEFALAEQVEYAQAGAVAEALVYPYEFHGGWSQTGIYL